MVFRRSYILGLAIAAVASFGAAVRTVGESIAGSLVAFGHLMLAIVALPNELRFATEGYVDFDAQGDPLDSALQQSMRHEAGMRTRAAARHT